MKKRTSRRPFSDGKNEHIDQSAVPGERLLGRQFASNRVVVTALTSAVAAFGIAALSGERTGSPNGQRTVSTG
jgi:hypothetical protein